MTSTLTTALAPVGSPAAAKHSISRLLAVITPLEREQFLPGEIEKILHALSEKILWVDRHALSEEAWLHLLYEFDPEVMVTCWSSPPLPKRLPDSLRYICHLGGSVKMLVTRGQIEGGLLVTNWGSSISRTVAEWALFHILGCLRQAGHWLVAMHRDGAWKPKMLNTSSLFAKRVGIHGFGAIARELVKLLEPFRVPISVHAPDLDQALADRKGVEICRDLETLFLDNDIIVELAPLLPETTGIVKEHHLRLIRPGGVFVNIGRGAVVDPEALLRVAREGNIQFGLDVFAEEPLSPESELRGLPNVILTPHLAGPTPDRRCDAGLFAVRNLRAYVEGRPIEALVTPDVFDRST